MRSMVFTLRRYPEQRVDLSPLVPHRLVGLAAAEIAAVAIGTTRVPVVVGDVFRLRMGDPRSIRIDGGCDRLDRVGDGMVDGAIMVDGDVGLQAGRRMTGGRLTVTGAAGPWAASGMSGGIIDIGGAAGERLGGPLAGEIAGMRGGVVVVRGDTGARAGDRMRRGTIVIEGSAGAEAGSGMIAGTLIVRGSSGPMPGRLMRRGTIVLGADSAQLAPTFVDCGVHELVAMRLMAAFVLPVSAVSARLLRAPLRRLAGDMAALGRGEILVRARS